MAGNGPLLDTQAIQLQYREAVSFFGSTSTRRTALTLHEACNLSFSPAGPDVFESRARKQKEKKKCLVSSANTYPNHHDTWQEGESLERSGDPCPGSQHAAPLPPSPTGLCPGLRGHKHGHSRLPGLLRTQKGNSDSALSEQLPAVLKLLRT